MKKRSKIIIIVMFCVSIIVRIYSENYPNIIERFYTQGVNKLIREGLSIITGLVPISIMEIGIFILPLVLIVFLYKLVMSILKKRFLKFVSNIILTGMIIFIAYIFMWDLNYNKVPLDKLLGYEIKKSKDIDLKIVCLDYLIKSNELRNSVNEKEGVFKLTKSHSKVMDDFKNEFNKMSGRYLFLKGRYGKTKSIILSEKMSYMGLTGIYCPFTCESNVNVNEHDLLIPSTIAHEMAHQRGFAKEDEAGFISYLICENSSNVNYKYSGYIMSLMYLMNKLYDEDQEMYWEFRSMYSQGVDNDMRDYSKHWKKYEGKVNEVTSKVNDAYLKANGQDDGEKSYGNMVDLLIAKYHYENNQ